MTKEELIEENGQLKENIKSLEKQDELLREQFSKVLDAPYEKNPYSDGEIYIYSWHEIFAEIGKLLEKERIVSQKSKIKKIENDVKELFLIYENNQRKKQSSPTDSALADKL